MRMAVIKTVIFVLFLPAIAQGVSHPVYNPTEYVDVCNASDHTSSVSNLQGRVSDLLAMNETELRAELDNSGKSGSGYDDCGIGLGSNIETADDVYILAMLYHLTSTTDYAWRAAVLLDRYSEVYPNWPKSWGNDKGYGIWTNWFEWDMNVASRLAVAYDLIQPSGQLTVVGSSDAAIETMLNDIVDDNFDYRLYTSNVSYLWPLGIVIFGRVLDDPELAHVGYWFFHKHIQEMTDQDGWWYEGTGSYHHQFYSRIVESHFRDLYAFCFDGYSDPDPFSYTPFDRLDPSRFDNYNFETLHGDQLDRIYNAWKNSENPDGHLTLMNDTAHYGYAFGDPPTTSTLYNGLGHAVLANGTGSSQTQARLDFSHAVGHAHYDALHLIYYDKGEEVIGGTGYNEGSRSWNTSTLNQNLVVVNAAEQKYVYFVDWTMSPYSPDGDDTGTITRQTLSSNTNQHNNLLLFEPGYSTFNNVKVTEVDALDAYDDEATKYRRLLALVNISGSDMYLVDFFRVKGGTQYDWCIHGTSDNTYTYSDNLSMGSASGTFGSITFTNSATTANSWKATFDYSGGVSLDFNMIGVSGTTIYKGTGPRSGTGTQGYYVARRTAATGDDVVYMATHEAYTSSPHISSIEKLEFDGDDGTAIGIKVTLDGGKIDYVIATTDSSPYTEHTVTGVSNFNIKGRFAHVRVTSGVVTWAYLVEGSKLTYGATVNLTGTYNYSGTISDVNRVVDGDADNSFLVSGGFPTGSALTNKTLILTWDNGWTWGYKITSSTGSKIIIDGEPAFYLDSGNIEMEYFPVPEQLGLNYYSGPVTYLVPGSAVYDQGQVLTTAINSACSMSGTGGSRFAGTGAAIME